MFRTRPRGSLRAAALLAAGVAPLLAGAASATAAPSLDGLNGNLGDAPELTNDLVGQVGEIASGKTVKLPTPTALPQTPPILQSVDPAHALPVSGPVPPTATRAADERALPALPVLSTADELPVNALPVNHLPVTQLPTDQLPVGQLPVGQLPILGSLASAGLPSLG
ncbi:MAG: hypothetical protein ABWY11_26080 [Umezawaea sp.]